MEYLPLAWAIIIAFSIVVYVILDGFTLGTAILMPFLSIRERDLAMSVLLPTWDGNQTWLVLGGACLYGAFPAAFSVLMPVLYLPLMAMVLALLFRGVVFEFRLKDRSHVKYWDLTFTIASAIVIFIQGTILANFVSGFEYGTEPLLNSRNSFFSPFSLFVSISLMLGYCLLGATRLIYKTEGDLQDKMYKFSLYCGFSIIASIGIVSLWTPFVHEAIFLRWFGNHNWLLLMILPYMCGITFLMFWYSIRKREENLPFLCSVGFFIYSYIGFLICLYPYIVPYKLTLWEAAAPNGSLYFMLFGTVIMLPILVLYTAYAYRVFKGKVKNVFEY
ncbi:MAG: cytochrome d ubiquinol oxidase subunit II [Gammaproteobacteria bacterium]|nr:cytochrome d ubiquinol oxidase subunit II [Gammaproteobacteria bacterium]